MVRWSLIRIGTRLAPAPGHRVRTGLETFRDLFHGTKSSGVWLQGSGSPLPAETYAQLFGVPARQWAFPPLSHLVRMYPLGLEVSQGRPERIIRSPLQVEVDGSFRMNASIGEGQTVHLMIGDAQACLGKHARFSSSGTGPVWESLSADGTGFCRSGLETLREMRPGMLTTNSGEELGTAPLLGAYTLGQATRPAGDELVRFFNQAILTAVIGQI